MDFIGLVIGGCVGLILTMVFLAWAIQNGPVILLLGVIGIGGYVWYLFSDPPESGDYGE